MNSATSGSDRLTQHYRRVVRELVATHARRTDEPLVIAVRFRLSEPDDIHLLEVIENFPGEDDDEIFHTEFAPTAELIILGKLHLYLASPAQIRSAIQRNDPLIDDVRAGEELFRAKEGALRDSALELLQQIGLAG